MYRLFLYMMLMETEVGVDGTVRVDETGEVPIDDEKLLR